jgi:hypothetical protein
MKPRTWITVAVVESRELSRLYAKLGVPKGFGSHCVLTIGTIHDGPAWGRAPQGHTE